MENLSFLVDKSDLDKTTVSSQEKPVLESGEVLFQIEKFAMTTNNITYAVLGHELKYWNFFPAIDPWGIIPAWGFAKVIDSKVDEIKVGQRYYGYIPMSNYLKIKAGKISPFGFSDIAAHRKGLAPIYNNYMLIDNDLSYSPELENYLPIIRPLFSTSFLNYQLLKTKSFFEADQIVLTSASSKTALGLAYLLKQNQAADQKSIIGLTSTRNVPFVENTGFYDQVVSYDDRANLLNQDTTVVDFSGNGSLLKSIEGDLGEQLKFISLIGFADWKSRISEIKIPVAEFFFAPTFGQQYFKEVGVAVAMKHISIAMKDFIKTMQSSIEISYVEDFEALANLYKGMLAGKVDPAKGYIWKT